MKLNEQNSELILKGALQYLHLQGGEHLATS